MADHRQSLQELKRVITSKLVLRFVNFSRPFKVHIVVYNYAINGVLMQDRHTIAFGSQKLNEIEHQYLVHKKEMITEFLAEFDLVLKYKLGKVNVVVDALCRKMDHMVMVTVAAWLERDHRDVSMRRPKDT
ncbi:hypothetical protein AMTR_s00015p00038300 [Amborella trichopoda]|uniref:Reverse transcriptase/retrotransposon-derived protein RNase H-like domain-containing protein n=1 Tax=Amborella trichopoda TaxID=13333 RepID=W1PNT0_AMBTC|nr:hypothetical protein AMTR_s00015p00038300 [Amborella trichopoda]